jgi:hypothetical protein
VPESNHSRDNYVQPIFSVDVIVVNPFYFDGTLNEKRKGMEVRVSILPQRQQHATVHGIVIAEYLKQETLTPGICFGPMTSLNE